LAARPGVLTVLFLPVSPPGPRPIVSNRLGNVLPELNEVEPVSLPKTGIRYVSGCRTNLESTIAKTQHIRIAGESGEIRPLALRLGSDIA